MDDQFADINKIRGEILDCIKSLLELREASECYSKIQNDINTQKLHESFSIFNRNCDNIKDNLVIMIKQANGVQDEVIGKQENNGIFLD